MSVREEIYFANLRHTQEFEAALHGAFEYVHLSNKYYLGFVKKTPKIEYHRERYFKNHISENRRNIANVACDIDKDVNLYWRASLASLAMDHEFLMKKYREYGETNDAGHLISIHKEPISAHLNLVTDDIAKADSLLPKCKFSEPSDIKTWQELAKISIPPINDAFQAHCEAQDVLNNHAKERGERVAHILTTAASSAVKLGSIILGASLG
jgi:hypothetical protein